MTYIDRYFIFEGECSSILTVLLAHYFTLVMPASFTSVLSLFLSVLMLPSSF